ncbi:hypothetical protein Tco_0653337 [Tanacetum coccineum]|uniref:Uncharacterized protein n=1 Tax=Tanacetum coccineum TaxID=301880 RepID=A0ABQ4X0I8_9ASTR
MSDYEHSTVTYTSVSIPVEDDSDMGSPGVDGPPSPDYVPGPEEPEQAPPHSVYLPFMYWSGGTGVYTPRVRNDVFQPMEQPLLPLPHPLRFDDTMRMMMRKEDEGRMEHLKLPAGLYSSSPPASPIRPLGYRAAMIRLRAKTPSTSHSLPLPTSSPLLQLLSSDHKTDRPEITLPPRKRLGIDLGPRYEIGESLAAAATRPVGGRRADYGFVGTMDTEIRRRRAEEVGYGIRDVWIDPREAVEEDIYAVIEDTQDRQTQIYQSVGTLVDDSQYHYETARLLDQEALVSREAWGRSIEVSYMTRSEILALRSVVIGQQAVISQLQAADRKSQVVTLEMLLADYQRQVQLTKALELLKGLQTQMAELQRQLGPAKGPAQPDAPGEAGSSS